MIVAVDGSSQPVDSQLASSLRLRVSVAATHQSPCIRMNWLNSHNDSTTNNITGTITHTDSYHHGMGTAFSCSCVCPCSKRKTGRAINAFEVTRHIVDGRPQACTDLKTKGHRMSMLGLGLVRGKGLHVNTSAHFF